MWDSQEPRGRIDMLNTNRAVMRYYNRFSDMLITHFVIGCRNNIPRCNGRKRCLKLCDAVGLSLHMRPEPNNNSVRSSEHYPPTMQKSPSQVEAPSDSGTSGITIVNGNLRIAEIADVPTMRHSKTRITAELPTYK